MLDRLNVWGTQIDGRLAVIEAATQANHTEVQTLQSQVIATQSALISTVDQAKAALNDMTEGFRQEVTAMNKKMREDGGQQLLSLQTLATDAQAKSVSLR